MTTPDPQSGPLHAFEGVVSDIHINIFQETMIPYRPFLTEYLEAISLYKFSPNSKI